jgi:hypothetical protein
VGLPVAATAQSPFYCESYGEYDPGWNKVNGYSRTWYYWGMDTEIEADSTLYSPNWQVLDSDSQWTPGLDITAYVSGVANQSGYYTVRGEHYYLDTGTWTWMWIQETSYTVDVAGDPEIWSVDPPGPWEAGGVYDVTVTGPGFLGQIAHVCGGGDWDSLSVVSDLMIRGNVQVSPWPNYGVLICVGAAVYGAIEVIEPPLIVAMKLEKVGNTTISTDGKYSENTTIRVTAYNLNTRQPLTSFSGSVNIAESGTAIYSQNGGTLPSSLTLRSGTGTFVAKSLAGPKVEGAAGQKPDPARITVTNFPVYGSDLFVEQWVISGDRIDFHLLSRICGLILAPVVVPSCDIARFPSLDRCESHRIVWSPLGFCC